MWTRKGLQDVELAVLDKITSCSWQNMSLRCQSDRVAKEKITFSLILDLVTD